MKAGTAPTRSAMGAMTMTTSIPTVSPFAVISSSDRFRMTRPSSLIKDRTASDLYKALLEPQTGPDMENVPCSIPPVSRRRSALTIQQEQEEKKKQEELRKLAELTEKFEARLQLTESAFQQAEKESKKQRKFQAVATARKQQLTRRRSSDTNMSMSESNEQVQRVRVPAAAPEHDRQWYAQAALEESSVNSNHSSTRNRRSSRQATPPPQVPGGSNVAKFKPSALSVLISQASDINRMRNTNSVDTTASGISVSRGNDKEIQRAFQDLMPSSQQPSLSPVLSASASVAPPMVGGSYTGPSSNTSVASLASAATSATTVTTVTSPYGGYRPAPLEDVRYLTAKRDEAQRNRTRRLEYAVKEASKPASQDTDDEALVRAKKRMFARDDVF
jgi:hypothetical protein